MGRGQLTPAGAPRGDSFPTGVTERLSVRGLGLNSHLASLLENVCHSLRGRAGERGSGCANQWKLISTAAKTTPSSRLVGFRGVTVKDGAGSRVFHHTDPSPQAPMGVLSTGVVTLGGETFLPRACGAVGPALGVGGEGQPVLLLCSHDSFSSNNYITHAWSWSLDAPRLTPKGWDWI